MRKKDLMLSLKPSVINRYQRKYFLSFDQKFRVTLDHHLEYFPVSSLEQLSFRGLKDSLSMIMELKYSPIYQLESTNITQEFPFRVIKNSKYVRGVQILYNFRTPYIILIWFKIEFGVCFVLYLLKAYPKLSQRGRRV